MGTLWQDLKYAARMLRKNPGFTAVAVLTLALGIGANTAIFSVIDAVMLRMLPVQNPQQLVAIGDPSRIHAWSNGNPRTDLFSYPLYRELRDHNAVFSSVLASCYVGLQINIQGGPEKVSGRLVTGNYFETLGVKPLLGRTFTDDEERGPGSDPAVVISYGYWRDRFSGDPSVIGRAVRLNNYPFTIIGVASPGFFGEVVGDRTDLWAPMIMEPQLLPGRDFLDTPDTSALLFMGRLKAGVTIQQARQDVNVVVSRALTDTLSARLSADDRSVLRMRKLAVELSPGGRGLSRLREEFSRPLLLMMGLAALVLFVGCVNVASLLLARLAARQREIALRMAIGAGPGRIVRQLLSEALLLALAGCGLGLLFTNWVAAGLVAQADRANASPLIISLDWRVLVFSGVACVTAALLSGLVPARQFLNVNPYPTLKGGGRDAAGASAARTRRILVSSQIALGVLVLMTAGLLIRSLSKLQEVDLGYSRNQLLLAKVDIAVSGYKGPAAQNVIRELLDGLSSLPGVRSVTASTNGLFSGSESSDAIRVEGFSSSNRQDLVTDDDEIGPDYFSTIGVPIVLGREIGEQDFRTAAHVAVVNETFARFYFGARNPLGYKIYIQDSDHPNQPPYEIIGVAGDIHDHEVRAPVRRRMYAPLTSAAFDDAGAPNFELRTVGNPLALINSVRKRIHQLDANLYIDNVETGGDLVSDALTSQALVAKLSAILGALVLLLVAVGIYGVMSYSVEQRTHEIGIRSALGASRRDMLQLVLLQSLRMALAGIVMGVAAALGFSRLLSAQLFGVKPSDPLTFAGVPMILLAVAIVAAYVPARRAMRVDPIVALRHE